MCFARCARARARAHARRFRMMLTHISSAEQFFMRKVWSGSNPRPFFASYSSMIVDGPTYSLQCVRGRRGQSRGGGRRREVSGCMRVGWRACALADERESSLASAQNHVHQMNTHDQSHTTRHIKTKRALQCPTVLIQWPQGQCALCAAVLIAHSAGMGSLTATEHMHWTAWACAFRSTCTCTARMIA